MGMVKAAVILGNLQESDEYVYKFVAHEISEWEEIHEADIEKIEKGLRILDQRPAVRDRGYCHKLIILADKKNKVIENAWAAYEETTKKEEREKRMKEEKERKMKLTKDLRKKRSDLKRTLKALDGSSTLTPEVVSSIQKELEVVELELAKK